MSRFVLLESDLWEDAHFKRVGPDARLLFLWAWSNKKAAVSGLYVATPSEMVASFARPGELTGENVRRLVEAREQLAVKPLMLYDPEASLLWVVNRGRYANRGPGTVVAMRREWQQAPASPLRDLFIKKYGEALGVRR